MTQYLLIFNRTIDDEEREKIITISGAFNSSVLSNSQRNISDLFEVLSYSNYEIDEYSSFAMMIETEKPPIMVAMLGQSSPALTLEIKPEFDAVIDRLNYALNKYLEHECRIANLSAGSSAYKSAYQSAFGEQSIFEDDALIRNIEERIEKERVMLIEKMHKAIDMFKMKNE